jgi:type I restriction enzyme S subunit
MSELPKGWEDADLGFLLDRLQYGLTAKADKSASGTRFVRITDIEDYQIKWDGVPGITDHINVDPKYLLQEGDFIFARSGSIEKVCRVSDSPRDAVFASYLIRGRPLLTEVSDWLYWFIRSNKYLSQVMDRAAGIGMSNVNARKLSTIRIPIAPEQEQRRIVSKLDGLFERTRRAREELSQIPPLIQNYKKAILEAAFRGDLTKNWRESNPVAVSGEKFRHFLLQKYEESLVPRNGQKRHRSIPPEFSAEKTLPRLPDTWTWMPVSTLSAKV